MLSTALPAQVAQLVEQRTENPCATPTRSGSKLEAADVVRLREFRAAGHRVEGLARTFGVCSSLVSQVCTGRLWRDAGGPLTRSFRDRTRPLDERFWEQVAKYGPDDCWPWTGGLDRCGYGRLYAGGRCLQANRVALELKLGRELGRDEVARHTCDNRPCCNPAHLIPGAIADTNADMVQRGRQSRGESHPFARLTEADVLEIRRLSSETTATELARRYGVSDRTIRNVATGKKWKHVGATP